MSPKTRKNTPFYKVFISKLFTKTKLLTFIDIYIASIVCTRIVEMVKIV